MPISFFIQPDQRLVSYVIRGSTTVAEAQACLDEIISHPQFERGFGFVGDRRGIDEDATADYMIAIGRLIKARANRLSPCRWAVMVRSEADFALVRVWAMALQDTGVVMEPFTVFDRANSWARGASRYEEASSGSATN